MALHPSPAPPFRGSGQGVILPPFQHLPVFILLSPSPDECVSG